MKLTKEQLKIVLMELEVNTDENRVHYQEVQKLAKEKFDKDIEWCEFVDMASNKEEFFYANGYIRMRKDNPREEKHYQILDFLYLLRGERVRDLYRDDEFVNQFPEEEQKYGSSYEILKEIFNYGNCGNVAKMLQVFYPDAKACLLNNHILTLIDGRFYDIDGEVKLCNLESPDYTILDERELDDYVNNYSFYTRGPIL